MSVKIKTNFAQMRLKGHCTRPVRRGGEIESTGSQSGHSCS